MDLQTDEWMDMQMDGWILVGLFGGMDGWRTDRSLDRCSQINGWMDRWTDGQMNEWMNWQMNE